MKIEIFKKKKKFKKGGFHTNPNMGWELILYLVFLLIVAALVFGAYLFLETKQERGQENIGGPHIRIVKKERIQKVLQYFSSREEKSAEILLSPSPIIDPSL